MSIESLTTTDYMALVAEKLSPARLRSRGLGFALSYPDIESAWMHLAYQQVLLEEMNAMLELAMKRVGAEERLSSDALYIMEQVRPHLKRGKKILDSAAKGNAAVYGTSAEKLAKRVEYQKYIDELHAKNSRLSFRDLQSFAGNHFKVSTKTIQRYTVNPKTPKVK